MKDGDNMSQWQPIATAPKDGREVLLGGRWRGHELIPAQEGQWCAVIASYGSFSSRIDGKREWIAQFMMPLDSVNVDFTDWQPLPEPPA